MKSTILILIIVIMIGLSVTGFFFFMNRTLASENIAMEGKLSLAKQKFANLKDEKIKTETEVAVLKAINFAKEIELLRFKIKNAENDFVTAKKKAAKLETNLNKTKPYKDVLIAIDNFFDRPPTSVNLNTIDTKINVLGNSQITAQWVKAKEDLNEYIRTGSWGTREIVRTISLIVSQIRSLVF